MVKLKEAPTIEDLEHQRGDLLLTLEQTTDDDAKREAHDELLRVESALAGIRVDTERARAAESARERQEAEKAREAERRKRARLAKKRREAAAKRRESAAEAQGHLDALVDLLVRLDEIAMEHHNERASGWLAQALLETLRRRCPDSVTRKEIERDVRVSRAHRYPRNLVEHEEAATSKWLRGGR